ncbi:hypothetical protein Drose_27200 [Dactylosporangium roseum]|uniref:Uncharacterized protein n=1 Tax=Dactylosporangium roseum TaxID=47989 RepID=A0ABY5YYP1_9ACTN|nr:hypothetical protein [Dactylosporangium roseum]UWZ34853.1 hypothetical protein Drose_27200 [Dactylosporangium roseum]
MPARSAKPSSPAAESDRVSAEESEDRPSNPLEAIRRAQANRSLPPGSGGRGGARGGAGKGATPKAPRMYNRHK